MPKPTRRAATSRTRSPFSVARIPSSKHSWGSTWRSARSGRSSRSRPVCRSAPTGRFRSISAKRRPIRPPVRSPRSSSCGVGARPRRRDRDVRGRAAAIADPEDRGLLDRLNTTITELARLALNVSEEARADERQKAIKELKPARTSRRCSASTAPSCAHGYCQSRSKPYSPRYPTTRCWSSRSFVRSIAGRAECRSLWRAALRGFVAQAWVPAADPAPPGRSTRIDALRLAARSERSDVKACPRRTGDATAACVIR